MKSPAALFWLFLLLLVVVVYGAYKLRQYTDSHEAPPEPAPVTSGFSVGDFSLTDSSGKPFHARDMQGQVWVASFFFSDCPSLCIRTNNQIADLLKKELKDLPVTFVSVSVDPKRDTPERLAEYAGKFNGGIDPDRWVFLTDEKGSTDAIKNVCENVKLAYGHQTHSDRLVLIDPKGVVQGMYQGMVEGDVKRLVKKARELCELAAEPPASPATSSANPPAGKSS
ncbi:MAG: SCO family protein [Planctomycetia bacterium]|nr:SCO family protein [Planctomycetia bacterium]